MLKANVILKDHTILKQVKLFKSKDMGDTQILTESEAISHLHGNKIVFFGGLYVQGGFIPEQILNYQLFEDENMIEKRIKDFVSNAPTYYVDTADFILNHREELLKLLK